MTLTEKQQKISALSSDKVDRNKYLASKEIILDKTR